MGKSKSVPSKCVNCDFWNRLPADVQGEVETGECKRYPPEMVHLKDDEGDLRSCFMSPVTEYNDHCGEFKLRVDA